MKRHIIPIIILIQAFLISLVAGVFLIAAKPSAAFADTRNAGDSPFKSAPENIGELQSASGEQLDYWAENLASFDGRDFGYITPARNQYTKNTCWAFAAVGAAEASVLREGINKNATKDNLDFDETIVAYNRHTRDGSQDPLLLTANDKYNYGKWNQGDTGAVFAFSVMTQGYTLLRENGFHQSVEESVIKSALKQSDYYVQSYQSVPDDKNAIKRAVIQYGAVTFNYSAPSRTKYYDSSAASNHSSIIVGWDDTVASSEFGPRQPKEDGAWIIKNSWGDFMGENGFYYISYEQPIGGLFSVDLAMKEDYQNIYHYDGDVTISMRNYAAEAQAAVYEAKLSSPTKQERLKAVAIYVPQGDLNVNVKIYKNLNVNPGNVNDQTNIPNQGAPAGEINTHIGRSGMHTINLESPIDLGQGEYFSIVVSCKNKFNSSVPVSCAVDGNASVNDMTYYFYNGKWISYKNSKYYADTSTDNMSAKIRAITNTVERKTPLNNDLQYARVEVPNRLVYFEKGVQPVPEFEVYFDGKLLAQGQDYTVSVQYNDMPGKTAVTLSGLGEYTGTRTTYFDIAKAVNPPDMLSGTVEVYNDVIYLYDVPIPEGWDWAVENQKLTYGATYWPNSLKYVGEDSAFYQNTTCGFYVNKIDKDPVPTIDITSAEVEITGEFVYTGKKITPTVSVIYGGREMRPGVDYILTAQNNINAGTATAIIDGIGRYYGKITQNFDILPLDICSITELKLGATTFTYDGLEKTPEVIAYNGAHSLSYGDDFSAEYVNNVFAGPAAVIVKGKGNYKGERELNFTISQAERPTVAQTAIYLDGKVEKLSQIPLPEGFEWCDKDAEIIGNKLIAKAVYTGDDAASYKITELNFEIIIEEEQPAAPEIPQKSNHVWVAVGVSSAVLAVAAAGIFISIRRSRKK